MKNKEAFGELKTVEGSRLFVSQDVDDYMADLINQLNEKPGKGRHGTKMHKGAYPAAPGHRY